MERPQKAHRPSKNKGKGKEKQQGFNEKVSLIFYHLFVLTWYRLLLQNLAVELTVKEDGT